MSPKIFRASAGGVNHKSGFSDKRANNKRIPKKVTFTDAQKKEICVAADRFLELRRRAKLRQRQTTIIPDQHENNVQNRDGQRE